MRIYEELGLIQVEPFDDEDDNYTHLILEENKND